MIQIDDLITNALKNKLQSELRTYRALKSEILNYTTAKNAKPYDEAAECQIIKKMCKQREDSIADFKKAGREDLISSEMEELEILKKLLPKPSTDSEVYSFFNQLCAVRNWTTQKENFVEWAIPKNCMGEAIKLLKNAFPYNDVKDLSDLVKNNLA